MNKDNFFATLKLHLVSRFLSELSDIVELITQTSDSVVGYLIYLDKTSKYRCKQETRCSDNAPVLQINDNANVTENGVENFCICVR